MSKMLRTHQNKISNLAVALLLLGGCVFILTGSWNAPETVAASSCCGGGATATTLTTATTGGCCGSAGQVSDSDSDGHKCDCFDSGNTEADCGDCDSEDNCDDLTSKTNNHKCGGECEDSDCGTTECLKKGDIYCENNVPTDAETCSGDNEKYGTCLNK